MISKLCAVSLLGGVPLILAGLVYGGDIHGGAQTYGPYVCSSCSLGRPVMDAATSARISSIDADIHDGVFDNWSHKEASGDGFIVCNATACVTYSRTDSGGFVGGEATPRVSGGGGGGSGGGSGGFNGGGGSGGGSDPGCTFEIHCGGNSPY